MTAFIKRRFFNPKANLKNQQEKTKWMQDLSLQLDDIIQALNDSPNAFIPATLSDLTGSRTLGTVYQNSSRKTLFVSVSATNSITSDLSVFSGTVSPPTTAIAVATGGVVTVCLFFIVLPGSFYSVSFASGTPTLVQWAEWN